MKPLLKACIRFRRKEIGRHQLKEALIGTFLGGSTKMEIGRWNKIFLGFILPLIKRKVVFDKMQKHKKEAHQIYIISASLDIYLKPLAIHWKLDGAICTRLEWRNGRLTGRILGKNCREEEKARRLRASFTEADLKGSFAYGNSEADKPLLRQVSFGYLV